VIDLERKLQPDWPAQTILANLGFIQQTSTIANHNASADLEALSLPMIRKNVPVIRNRDPHSSRLGCPGFSKLHALRGISLTPEVLNMSGC
jgi:hypothetical protein